MMQNEKKQQLMMPTKKIDVFRVTGLKNLARVGTNTFFNYFFLEKMYNFMHFERQNAFQNAHNAFQNG